MLGGARMEDVVVVDWWLVLRLLKLVLARMECVVVVCPASILWLVTRVDWWKVWNGWMRNVAGL